ncbi:hypothetical protein AB4099_21250 [Bosea sp. 2KB_26]|uniref:hypothetical protein n=1 Tax=Bosea sp. 2KB_26 TaxID=3237475 RepID=UPI003F8FADA2
MLDQHESAGIDSTLRRLVEQASFPVHLVCDDALALLAVSAGRSFTPIASGH